jgi:hypothetical protein
VWRKLLRLICAEAAKASLEGTIGEGVMKYFAGIDVSLAEASVCVVDETGRVVTEGKVANEPELLVAFLAGTGLKLERVGLEAGPLSQWLYAGLAEAG